REVPDRSAAILADPLYEGRYRHLGRIELLPISELAEIFPRGAPEGRPGRLPFADLEAELVGTYFARPRIATGVEASRSLALSPELEPFSIVHIASHGWRDPRYAELSALLLSEFDARGRRIDGRLRLRDIFRLGWRAELVVASACRTGVGGELRSEGARGLARGFLYAGIPRAIVSQWEVDSRATAHFMDAFYRALVTRGSAPGAALRQARLELLRPADPVRRAWASPHVWGAFVLVGDWRSFEIPT
ncbi:MAG: CHAT domain-containing protein, partial [Holophagales bacterium]|nr:CHAT domain-containing protein [Holophagales bacterium]